MKEGKAISLPWGDFIKIEGTLDEMKISSAYIVTINSVYDVSSMGAISAASDEMYSSRK
jgi:hypothetical protein